MHIAAGMQATATVDSVSAASALDALAEDAAGNFRPVAANKLTPEVLS